MNKNLLVLILTIYSCCIRPIDRKRISGFTDAEFTKPKTHEIDVLIFDTLKSSGTLVNIQSKNLRNLGLFIKHKKDEKLNLQNILKTILLNNNPNNWPFYHAEIFLLNINRIIWQSKSFDGDGRNYTLSERYNISSFKKLKIGSYKIKYLFIDSGNFAVVNVDINKLNNSNFGRKVQGGPPNNKQSNSSTYYFNSKDSLMNMLIDINYLRFIQRSTE